MQDFTSKMIDGALNFALLTRENAEKVFNEFVKSGKISREEGQKLVAEFMAKFDAETANMSRRIKDELKKYVEDFGFATKKEMEELSDRLRKLEHHINEIHKKNKKDNN